MKKYSISIFLSLLLAITAFAANPKSISNECLELTLNSHGAVLHGAGKTAVRAEQIKVPGKLSAYDTRDINDAVWGRGKEIEARYSCGRILKYRLYEGNPFLHIATEVYAGAEPMSIKDIDVLTIGLGYKKGTKVNTLGSGGLAPVEKHEGSFTYMMVCEPQSRNAVLAAWLTQEHGLGLFALDEDKKDGCTLRARLEFGRFDVAKEKTRSADILVIGLFEDGREGLECYGDHLALQYDVRLPERPEVYCTWYHRKDSGSGASDENLIYENACFAAEQLAPFGLNTFQIDDHWQDTMIEGLNYKNVKKYDKDKIASGPFKIFGGANFNFPSGMAATSDRLNSKGFTSGLWFMPFAGDIRCGLFPEEIFTKRNSDGSLYEARTWSGATIDATSPAGEAFLRSRFKRIYDWGFRYFKVDGLHIGAPSENIYINRSYKGGSLYADVSIYDPESTFVECFRKGLRLIHEEAPEAFILGCSVTQNMSSFGPSFGLVDAMRVGPDNDKAALGVWAHVTRGADYAGNLYFLNNKVWYNDPDPYYVRETNPLNMARWMVSWQAVAGAMSTTSNQYETLPEERLDMIKRALPTHKLNARPIDILESTKPQIWQIKDERMIVLGLFNWNEKETTEIRCSMDRMELDNETEYEVFDFWDNVYLGRIRGELCESLPAASCKVLALRPCSSVPQVLSTSRHITQGIVDVVSETWDEAECSLQGVSKFVKNDAYELRIVVPDGYEFDSAECGNYKATVINEGRLLRISWLPELGGETNWKVNFKKIAVPAGEIRLLAAAIHPFWRTGAFPAEGMEVDACPVSFYWPSQRRDFDLPLEHYDFQLSRTPDFSKIEEEFVGREPSFAVVWKQLDNGMWYWRYRESGKEWQGPYAFTIGENTRRDMRPSSAAFANAVGGPHPRFVIPNSRLDIVREEFKNNGVTEKICKEAEQYMGVELPEKEWGGKFYKNGKRVFFNKKFPEDHIKSMITSPTWSAAIVSLCRAYLLTGNTAYADEALRWGLRVCSLEIMPGKLTYDNNPYPDGFCFAFYLNCVAHIYDTLYDYMNDGQREIVRDNLAKRLEYYYEYYCNRLENRCIDNHSWQISIGAFARAAIAAKGHIPEADKYLAYLYDIWMAIDPEQSRSDGGWFGGAYVSVNIDVWLEVPAYFSMYTGYNFYDTPFYRNHPYYFLFRQAPGSQEDGFSGDGYGVTNKYLSEKMRLWMSVLGQETGSGVASWLGQCTDKPNSGKFDLTAWTRLVFSSSLWSAEKAAAPKDLPRSRAFRDIGIVNMHTDLLNPEKDLHVALRSSPYGTFGHNLASHNAFNICYGGEFLFVPFGHRHGGAKNSAVCYRNSRGHNTVLIDGKGQPFSPEAYGWIARHIEGGKLIYACGDASNAYDAAPFYRENSAFREAGLEIDDYISRGQMKRFRRHVILAGNSLVLVYDELEANDPVRWDWVLHCRKDMTVDGHGLSVEGNIAKVDFETSSPINIAVHDKPLFMPVNVDGRGGEAAGSPYKVEGNHAIVSTEGKCGTLRLLSIIRVGDLPEIVRVDDGSIVCGEWTIIPEMNPEKIANLVVKSADMEFILKDAETGESVLREKKGQTWQEQRVKDELPYHALGVKYVSNVFPALNQK